MASHDFTPLPQASWALDSRTSTRPRRVLLWLVKYTEECRSVDVTTSMQSPLSVCSDILFRWHTTTPLGSCSLWRPTVKMSSIWGNTNMTHMTHMTSMTRMTHTTHTTHDTQDTHNTHATHMTLTGPSWGSFGGNILKCHWLSWLPHITMYFFTPKLAAMKGDWSIAADDMCVTGSLWGQVISCSWLRP